MKPLTSIAEWVEQAEAQNCGLHEVALQVEAQVSGQSREAIVAQFQQRLAIMRDSVSRGLATRQGRSLSGMTGGDAQRLAAWLEGRAPASGPILSRAMLYAIAVGEVNAAMGCIVAAPTAGSSGVLPGVLFSLQEGLGLSEMTVLQGLITAGAVGVVIGWRAMLSGAEGGCQAEVGAAAAMAAAAAVELQGGSPRQSAHALAITLKNMLGLVCDPVAGLVEVPCILRNASGAAQALLAADLALAGVESVIPPDEVIDAMGQVGRLLDVRFKETAQGGIAASPTGRRLAAQLRSEWGE
ncbi:MAG TPA: L-serine ammonia-lyase, iron-sulfur-dependent, subunit alpha [Anaerolineae bacterium]|nr:L-serine ammonia-lyase, iron-sulfur-dependent, subunit alpha [Anaerolineae bacterium]